MKKSLSALILALILTGCPDTPASRGLVEPTSSALEAARNLKTERPETEVGFSQINGRILWVKNQTLMPSGSLDREEAIQRVRSFLSLYPDLFPSSPDAAWGLARDPRTLNPAHRVDSETGLQSIRLTQVEGGFAVEGAELVAVFTPDGALRAVFGQSAPPPESEDEIGASRGSLALPLLPLRPGRTRRWIKRGADWNLVDMEEIQDGIQTRCRVYDSRSGELIRETVQVPRLGSEPADSLWFEGTPETVSAPDTLGETRSIFSTSYEGRLVLGFRTPEIFEEGEYLSVADADYNVVVPRLPMSTSSDWLSDSDYVSTQTLNTLVSSPTATPAHATRLAQHLETTLRWFWESHAWRSWDNRGSSFYAGVRGLRTAGEPDFNAYGANGFLLAGWGVSPTGQPLTDALDIVAHEFAHSVMNATTSFKYEGESGALNESIADFFGAAVTGFRVLEVATGAGVSLRHLLEPGRFGQPASYGEYEERPLDDDLGGIHLNSGIMNRALALAVLGDGRVENLTLPVSRLVLKMISNVAIGPASSLETFAVGSSIICDLLVDESVELVRAEVCERLDEAFETTELGGRVYRISP